MVEAITDPSEPVWTHADENAALLVDRLDYWLSQMYVSWTADPDDPAVRKKRLEQKRAGIKPAPIPIIPPVASRPKDRTAAIEKWNDLLTEHFATAPEPGKKPGETSIDTLDRLLG